MRRIEIKSSELSCQFVTDKLSGYVEARLECADSADIVIAQDLIHKQVNLMLVNAEGQSFRLGRGTIQRYTLNSTSGLSLEVSYTQTQRSYTSLCCRRRVVKKPGRRKKISLKQFLDEVQTELAELNAESVKLNQNITKLSKIGTDVWIQSLVEPGFFARQAQQRHGLLIAELKQL